MHILIDHTDTISKLNQNIILPKRLNQCLLHYTAYLNKQLLNFYQIILLTLINLLLQELSFLFIPCLVLRFNLLLLRMPCLVIEYFITISLLLIYVMLESFEKIACLGQVLIKTTTYILLVCFPIININRKIVLLDFFR